MPDLTNELKRKQEFVASAETAENGSASFPAPQYNSTSSQPIQLHEDHSDHEHDHDHTHEIDPTNAAPAGDAGTDDSTRDNIGGLTDKDDQVNKEIPDGELSLLEKLKKFIYQQRTFGPQFYTQTGGMNGFTVSMSPAAQMLNIAIQCKYNFHNGLSIDSAGVVTMNPSGYNSKDAILTTAMNDANSTMTPAERIPFVNSFTWTADEITAGVETMNQELKIVEDLWSFQHSFFIDKEGWRDERARVNVNVNGSQGTGVDGTDHLEIKNVKTPSGYSGSAAAVVPTGDVSSSRSLMVMDDDRMSGVNSTNFLHRVITFDNNSSELNAAQKTFLTRLIATHKDDNTTSPTVDNNVLNSFNLIGHSSSSGSASRNEELAAERILAVKTYLVDGGLDCADTRLESDNKGEEGATDDASWRRVDIMIGSGEAQHTLSHEFGHVFGLSDEYATGSNSLIGGTGSPAGTQVGHDGIATGIGAGNATAENNDGIMSLGNEVRGQHYATFGDALKTVTAIPEWKLVQ